MRQDGDAEVPLEQPGQVVPELDGQGVIEVELGLRRGELGRRRVGARPQARDVRRHDPGEEEGDHDDAQDDENREGNPEEE